MFRQRLALLLILLLARGQIARAQQPPVLIMGNNSGTLRPVAVNSVGELIVATTITGADGAIEDATDPAIEANVLDYTNANPLAVRLTDTNGDYVTAGGGTQYAVDTALGATPTGTLGIAIRDDALSTLVPIEGDAIGLRVDSLGALWTTVSGTVTVGDGGGSLTVDNTGTFAVQSAQSGTWTVQPGNTANTTPWLMRPHDGVDAADVTAAGELEVFCANCSGSGAVHIDNNAFTGAADDVAPMGALYDTTPPAVTDGNAGIPRMDSNRYLFTVFPSAQAVSQSGTWTLGAADADIGNVDLEIAGTAIAVNTGVASAQTLRTITASDSLDVVSLGTIDNAYAEVATDFAAVRITDGTSFLTLTQDATHDLAAAASGPQIMGEYDDTVPDPVDEGDAGRLRISINRNLYVTVRDAGGAERGLNINASNQLVATAVITDLIPGVTATALGKAEDAVAATGDTGIAALFMREDTPTSTAANGDYITPKTDSVGRVYVNCASGCGGSGGTSIADDAVFTPASTSVTPIGGFFDDVTPDSIDEGDAGAVRMSGNRNLYTTLRDAGGNERGANVNASNELLVNAGTVTIGTFPDNEPFNVAQINGVTPLMGNGVTGTGSQRVTIASDNTAFTVNIGTFPDNEPINVAQMNGVAVTMGNGISGTGVQRVTLASDSTGQVAIASGTVTTVSTVTTLSQLGGIALPIEDAAETAGGVGIYAMGVRRDTAASSAGTAGDNTMASYDALGRMWSRNGGPCGDWSRVLSVAINTAAAGNVELVALNGSDLIYVCGYSIVVDAAVDVQFIYGTGTACATGETDITGIWGFAANGGITQANGGATQFGAVPAGNALCIENSAAVQVSGHVAYVRTATP